MNITKATNRKKRFLRLGASESKFYKELFIAIFSSRKKDIEDSKSLDSFIDESFDEFMKMVD